MSSSDDDRAATTAAEPAGEPRRRWPRRAVVALWVLVFAGAGTALARSWDRIVDNLTGRPTPTSLPASASPVRPVGPRR